jgi:hypothetical protein
MKKREKRLQLHRETVRQLDTRTLGEKDLANAQGGVERLADANDRWSSCGAPDCC